MSDDHAGRGGAVIVPAQRAVAPDTIAGITEWLTGEFGDRLDLNVISGTVLDCRDGLGGDPPGSPPGLIELLSRQHLWHTADQQAERHPSSTGPA